MEKKFQLRKWLGLNEAAEHLSLVFEEAVSTFDLLQFCIEGHLAMSIRFWSPVRARPCRFVFSDSQDRPHEEWSDISERLYAQLLRVPLICEENQIRREQSVWLDTRGTFKPTESIEHLSGIYGLPGYGAAKYAIERMAFDESEASKEFELFHEGIIVFGPDKELFQLLRPGNDSKSAKPATHFPKHSALGVRTTDLHKFIENLRLSSDSVDQGDNRGEEMGTKERESLLKMVLAMAVAKYGYDPECTRDKACGNKAGSIPSDLESHGLGLHPDTIRKYLREAYEKFGVNELKS